MKTSLLLSAKLLVVVALTGFASEAFSQSCTATFPGGTVNWTALSWSCSGGGSAPTTNNGSYTESLTVGTLGNSDQLVMNISFNLTGNLVVNANAHTTISIPAGITVVINGNFTDDNNNVTLQVDGNLVVTGTLKAKNNTTLGGTGSISGGTLDLGNGATCDGTCPGLSFQNCSAGATVCANNTTTTTYTWDGSASGVWTDQLNWTPQRGTPAASDQLIFSGLGAARSTVTNIPAQTFGRLLVTGGSTYNFTSTAANTLVLANAENSSLQIDNGSTLNVGVAGGTPIALNLRTPVNSQNEIGGQLHMVNGLFTLATGSTLILHTNSAPLARTSGQVFLNNTCNLHFGQPGATGGPTIVLPSSIFSGAQTINSIVLNRTNGATLGDQSITVTSATFTLGDLNTNAAGRLIISSSAAQGTPVESLTSKIVGYAQTASRAVNNSAFNFLGFNMPGTTYVGNVVLVRRTGTAGANTFNAAQSIDVTWELTTTSSPVGGRSISFSWLSTWDNVNNPANPFNTYYYDVGPGWTPIGTAQNLAAVTSTRTSAAKTITDLTDVFTLADNTQVLPVTFASLLAEPHENMVNVFWSTATEMDNDKFVIEKKSSEGFYAIGEIAGAGNSLELKKYSFTDHSPATGWNYYRIKQIDYDGKFAYSKVVGANYDGVGIGITIFPNPTSDGVINFGGVEDETAVVVQDLRGRVIYTGSITNASPQLDVKSFASVSGLYYVVTQDGTNRKFHRVVVK